MFNKNKIKELQTKIDNLTFLNEMLSIKLKHNTYNNSDLNIQFEVVDNLFPERNGKYKLTKIIEKTNTNFTMEI